MFRLSCSRAVSAMKQKLYTHCDDATKESDIDVEDGSSSSPTILEQANASRLEGKVVTTPGQFENLKVMLSSGTVNSYDGFRVIVQKQVNLNTVVSHFYWLGSQVTGQPIYQYRIILPFDDGKLINVATDMDFNTEGEVKIPINSNVSFKSNFVLGDNQKSLSADLEIVDHCSATQIQYAHSPETALSVSYMQSITPFFTCGGLGQYSMKARSLSTALGAIYNDGENVVAAQWDGNIRVMYMRKVNPGRAHLSTDLLIGDDGSSKMSLGAEYTFKQSKLHMSIDSNLMLKSALDTTVVPGVQLQFCAEMAQAQGQYKFGYGIMMG